MDIQNVIQKKVISPLQFVKAYGAKHFAKLPVKQAEQPKKLIKSVSNSNRVTINNFSNKVRSKTILQRNNPKLLQKSKNSAFRQETIISLKNLLTQRVQNQAKVPKKKQARIAFKLNVFKEDIINKFDSKQIIQGIIVSNQQILAALAKFQTNIQVSKYAFSLINQMKRLSYKSLRSIYRSYLLKVTARICFSFKMYDHGLNIVRQIIDDMESSIIKSRPELEAILNIYFFFSKWLVASQSKSSDAFDVLILTIRYAWRVGNNEIEYSCYDLLGIVFFRDNQIALASVFHNMMSNPKQQSYISKLSNREFQKSQEWRMAMYIKNDSIAGDHIYFTSLRNTNQVILTYFKNFGHQTRRPQFQILSHFSRLRNFQNYFVQLKADASINFLSVKRTRILKVKIDKLVRIIEKLQLWLLSKI